MLRYPSFYPRSGGGTTMNNDNSKLYTSTLHSILKMNPFDHVVILSLHDNDFYVEMINEKMKELNNNWDEQLKDGASLFGMENWGLLKKAIHNMEGYVYLVGNERFQLKTSIQTFALRDKIFYIVIIR